MRRTGLLLPLLLVAALLAPSSAWAAQSDEDFLTVFQEYAISGGKLDPCKFSSALLASAKKGVSPDTEAYAPDLEDAIDAALRARASGACKGGGGDDGAAGAAPAPADPGASSGTPAPSQPQATPAPEPAPAPAPSATVAPTQTPAPAAEAVAAPAVTAPDLARTAGTGDEDDGPPAPLVGLAAIAVLALLGALLWALARTWEPRWAVSGRHVSGEAGWRLSAAWSEFTDWVRLGR